MSDTEFKESEFIDGEYQETGIVKRDTPGDIAELAAAPDGLVVVQQRYDVLDTLRKAAIKLTKPSDWLMFKDKKTGREIGYLQDCGCDRVASLFGISVFNIQGPEIIRDDKDASDFMAVYYGDGRCNITGQTVEAVEGSRSSTDDFITRNNITGSKRVYYTRKAARANLDGNIIRELAGLKSVPVEDLRESGIDTNRTIKGRGYGAQEARQHVADDSVPVCQKCGAPMKYIPAGTNKKTQKPYDAFYACSDDNCDYRQWIN